MKIQFLESESQLHYWEADYYFHSLPLSLSGTRSVLKSIRKWKTRFLRKNGITGEISPEGDPPVEEAGDTAKTRVVPPQNVFIKYSQSPACFPLKHSFSCLAIMRLFLFSLFALVALLAAFQGASAQRGTAWERAQCLICRGNDQERYDCCDKTGLCCDGRIKLVGNFPKASTTSYGR
ncbi:hypothetical protein NPIL_159761 [Nephila pilipes]|uniref:Uncharacterized protein n=1 Tax=Nephila pilipes TaxID=299642 RepID=A0A8X6PY00_NEPPI|nr:hypothetical protein NPIL_159761 [Nephila pilipes]